MASPFGATVTGRSMLFPCAAGVQMPQIGAQDAKVKVGLGKSQLSNILPMTIVPQDVNPVSNRYVQMVSTGLSFAEDVVEDRCLHMMPYNEKYFNQVFEPGNLVPPPKRSSSSVGRHDKRGTDARHMPCYLKKIVKPQPLTPLRKQVKEKAQQLHKQALMAAQESRGSQSTDELSTVTSSTFFMTELSPQEKQTGSSTLKAIAEEKTRGEPIRDIRQGSNREKVKGEQVPSEPAPQRSTKDSIVTFKSKDEGKSKVSSTTPTAPDSQSDDPVKSDWDDCLMSKLSQLTANWIVHERMPENKQKDKLSQTLEAWYGRPTHTDLVREEMSDGDEEEKKKQKDKKPKKKWRKKEASLLARVYNVSPPPVEALDPYSDDNKAPFYRQPAGIRRKKRTEAKEEAATRASIDGLPDPSSINATAHNVSVRKFVETPPPTLRDFLGPEVGDKMFDTDNLYQQEWLTGQTHVFNTSGDPGKICMDSNNKFQKQLQLERPQKAETWYTLPNELQGNKKSDKGHRPFQRPERGQRRWTGLPELINETEGLMMSSMEGFDLCNLKAVDPKQRRRVKQNHALVSIVHDWRSKWFLSGQFADSTPDDLIQDMADIQPHVRLKAIGTVGKATEYKPPPDNSVLLDSTNPDPVAEMPEQIFVALECLLDDSHEQVRKAAAITLYSLDRPSDKAKTRLREMLESESSVDRWASAQCLAHYGECDSDVVAEIIKQILSTETAIKYEQGIHLLAKISNSSTLVHCMVAEQLNSSSWRHRVIACKILPTLFGTINRDITQKLSELMWHDWHVEVRSAAAQCLGKTSHGRDVHDDIRDRIMNGSERTKLEAINKLGQLGIMTAKLLPAFLQCFTDLYVSIRCEVCITCGNLQIKEEHIVDRLVHLATFDPIWKVKALAIQALGKIGDVNDEIKECLVWAMRYEEKPGVRAEACHSLRVLDIQDDDVIDAMQERLLVESSPIVREEMIEALSVFGLSTSDDMDMVAQIKSEVRKLCTRNIIASQIIVNETDETKREQLRRMVCQTEKDIEALNEKKAGLLKRINSQAHSVDSIASSAQPRTSTPMPKVKFGSGSSSPEPVSREGTVFTPSAEKELEDILNQEEMESASGSQSARSRPVTGGSQEADAAEEVHSRIKVTHVDEDDDKVDAGVTDVGGGTEQEGDQKPAPLKHQLSLPLALPQSQSRLSRAPSDLKGSRLSLAQFSDRRSIISRDSLREREKMNQEVSAIYTDLDARYAYMIGDLIKIDRGLNTKGSSAESSTDNSMHHQLTDAEIQAAHAQIQEILSRNGDVDAAVGEMASEGQGAVGTLQEVEHQQSQTVTQMAENGGNDQTNAEGEATQEEEKKDADGEWKSFADTLSQDDVMSDGGSTSYPSYDNEENNVGRSFVSTAGLTGRASEYDNSMLHSDVESDNEA